MMNRFKDYYLSMMIEQDGVPRYASNVQSIEKVYRIFLKKGKEKEDFSYIEHRKGTDLVNAHHLKFSDSPIRDIDIYIPIRIKLNRDNPIQSMEYLVNLRDSGKLQKLLLL